MGDRPMLLAVNGTLMRGLTLTANVAEIAHPGGRHAYLVTREGW